MLKNILINCANLIGREDIISGINSVTDISDIKDENIKNDVLALISCFNFTVSSTFENYLELIFCEQVTSDNNCKIFYSKLDKLPLKILNVENENFKKVNFTIKPHFIITENRNTQFFVTYKYLPKKIEKLTSDVSFLDGKLERIISYGVISEFLAAKGKLTESELYNNKFISQLFLLKNNRERRLKSTFSL